MAVDIEAKIRERNNHLAVLLVDEDARRSRVSTSRARVVAVMTSLSTGVDGILFWMDGMMGKLQKDLAALIGTRPGATYKGLNNLSVANFSAASVGALAASGTGSLPTEQVAFARAKTLMNLDVFQSEAESAPPPAKASDASAI